MIYGAHKESGGGEAVLDGDRDGSRLLAHASDPHPPQVGLLQEEAGQKQVKAASDRQVMNLKKALKAILDAQGEARAQSGRGVLEHAQERAARQ